MTGDTLKPGHVADFTDSMAEAMDEAFRDEWQVAIGTPLLEAGARERKVLFSAIALGVVRHLEKNSEALKVIVNVTQKDTVLMQSDNARSISSTGGGAITGGVVDVTQINETNNLIESEGTGVISEVIIDD